MIKSFIRRFNSQFHAITRYILFSSIERFYQTRFTEHAFLTGNQTLLHRLENILKIHSLILNQFQSPVYQPIFMYAWFKGGFDVPYIKFKRLKYINFSFEEPNCQICNQNPTCIKCSYDFCSKSLCYNYSLNVTIIISFAALFSFYFCF